MKVERNVRSLIPKAYPSGYKVFGTRSVNVDKATIDLGMKKSFYPPTFYGHDLQSAILPKSIQLEIELVFEVDQGAGPSAVYCYDGVNFDKAQVYDEGKNYAGNKPIKRIDFICKGVGVVNDRSWVDKNGYYEIENGFIGPYLITSSGQILENTPTSHSQMGQFLIYQKQFLTSQSQQILVTESHAKDGAGIVNPPGCVGGYPICSYGGVFKKNEPLENCEQIFFTVKGQTRSAQHDHDEFGGKTVIHFLKSSFLKSKGITQSQKMPLSGSVSDKDAFKPVFLQEVKNHHFESLGDDLEHRKIKLNLNLNVDEQGKSKHETQPQLASYQAYSWRHKQDNIWIFDFKIDENEDEK